MLRKSVSMSGLTVSRPASGRIMPFSKTRTVLIKPARPAAPSGCPKFAFSDETYGASVFSLHAEKKMFR
jgi:hypothetical protein